MAEEHDEAEAERSAVDEVLAELRQASQHHANRLKDIEYDELAQVFATIAHKLTLYGVAVPKRFGPSMIVRVLESYLFDITERLSHQVKLRVHAEQREAEARSQVADLALELLGASHQAEKAKAELMSAMADLGEACDSREHLEHELTRLRGLLAADPQRDGRAERARVALDGIRCDILDTGWPLGDDTDQELTPRRLVRELLAEVASLRARLASGSQDAERAQSALHARAVAAESALANMLQPLPSPAPAPAPSPDTSPSARRWRLTSDLLERLPEALHYLKVLQIYPSLHPDIKADALCVAPDGSHWVVLHEDFIKGRAGEPDRQMISVRCADENGKPLTRGAVYYVVQCLPADLLPVVVPDEGSALPG